jgi:CheY-like chemotaxis protein
MNETNVDVLLIEDSKMQQVFITKNIEQTKRQAFKVRCADTLASGISLMTDLPADVVLLDLALPDSTGRDTLVRFLDKFPKTAVVVLTSLDEDSLGLELIQAGAQDYLVKDEVSTRSLIRALIYAVERKNALLEHERMLEQLKSFIKEIKTLHGLLPICAYCKKIRDDTGYWNQIERYIMAHSVANFTHGVCPECAASVRKELEKRKNEEPKAA